MSKNIITKAVFPVAGFGTRFLPATKAMPKELIPILEKPLIQYAAEEAVLAGIKTLVFITGRAKRAIEDHFDVNNDLELALRSKGKNDQAEQVRNILPQDVECVFVRQSQQLGLGHAISCAESVIGSDPFAVLLADELLISERTESVTAELISAFYKSKKSQILTMEVEETEKSKYGIVERDEERNCVSSIIEKPKANDTKSNIASIGRYVLSPDIFDALRNTKRGAGDEIQLADAIDYQAKKGLVESFMFSGHRFDCGGVSGFVKATIFEGKKRGLC